MFKWCCEQQSDMKQELFIYRGNNFSKRTIITTSELNQAIINQDHPYQIYQLSRYDQYLQNCIEKKKLFVDRHFNTNTQDIKKRNGRNIIWIRLKQFVKDLEQKLFQELTISDIILLSQSDSYFLPTLAVINQQSATINRILGGNNNLNEWGIYKLNICVNGKPKTVIIDDFLPVYEDNQFRTAFSKTRKGALWVLLFQKAYAKINGGYTNIASGYAHEVLATFTLAPCLYYSIPFDFSHEMQEYVWQKIYEARRHHFPIVCGSRKRFTCPGIFLSQTYPILDCWIESDKQNKERIIKLANIPGYNYQLHDLQNQKQQKIQICDNGQSIKLQIVEFMRNFEVIDIAYIEPNFSSYFYTFKSSAGQYKFYKVKLPPNINFYLTNQKQSRLTGRMRIFLSRIIDNSTLKYQLIQSKIQQIYSDVSLSCKNLEKGQYIVCCQSQIQSDCFLRIYSQAPLQFEEVQINWLKFLQNIFLNYAITHAEQQIRISKNSHDWYLSKMLLEELAIGFIVISIDNNSNALCTISFLKDEIQKAGFKVINKYERNFNVILQKGQKIVLILETNKGQDLLQFPPKQLSIKLTI